MRHWKPIFIENSKLPVILSKIAPIEIYAIALGLFVWCRGEMDEETRNHETIHFQQQLELLFIGQWFLYIAVWLVLLLKYKSGIMAYRFSPFEREAYDHEHNLDYCLERKRYAWIKYITDPSPPENPLT